MGTNTPEPLYVKKDFYGEKLNWKELLENINTIRENQKKELQIHTV